jgi:hypothetical protein
VIWATRRNCHVDRTACAWLIKRFLDADAEFVFVDDPDNVPPDAIAFDIRGAELSHHDGDCSFETLLKHYRLQDPALMALAALVHEADLGDERYDVPEAAGLDLVIRALGTERTDDELLSATNRLFESLYTLYVTRPQVRPRQGIPLL